MLCRAPSLKRAPLALGEVFESFHVSPIARAKLIAAIKRKVGYNFAYKHWPSLFRDPSLSAGPEEAECPNP
jgi:hypothetical protein